MKRDTAIALEQAAIDADFASLMKPVVLSLKPLVYEIPLRTYSTNIWRQWSRHKIARIVASEHEAVALFMNGDGRKLKALGLAGGVHVHLTRFGPKTLDDDNLRGAFKATRDEIAAQLGVDDGDLPKVQFHYHQARKSDGHGHDHAIRIEIAGGTG